MDCGLPVIEKLVNFSPFLVRIILCNSLFFKAHCYHLEAPGPVPRLAPGQLAHVAEDGGGLGQGHVTVHQNWDLLERKLGPFPIFSPDEYESILCCPWLSKYFVTHLKSLMLTSSWGIAVDLRSNRVERNGWEMRSPNSFNADIAKGGKEGSLKVL